MTTAKQSSTDGSKPSFRTLRKCLVHRVGVNADRTNAVVFVELRDEARDQAFAHAALPLKGEVYGSGAFGGLRRVIHQRVRRQ